MVSIAAQPSNFDPLESFNQAVLLRNLRQRTQRINIPETFWHSPRLKKFADSPDSSLMLVKGNFQGRGSLRDAAVRITEELHRKHIPTLWAVNTQSGGADNTKPATPNDILKSLVAQALKLNDSSQSQKSAALSCSALRTAATQNQWFDILGGALANLHGKIYIIIELELLTSHADNDNASSSTEILRLFYKLFQELSSRGLASKIKVMVFTWRPFAAAAPSHASPNTQSITMPNKPIARPRTKMGTRKSQIEQSYRTTLRRLVC